MQLNGHEITIHKGESFTIFKLLRNRDGTPYIISNELSNAYFLLSITSSLYSQSERYSKKYWLKISDALPTFDLTVPIHIKTLVNKDGTSLYTKLSEVESFPINCYINDELVELGDRYSVFYDDENVYKYWDNGWKLYDCRIVKTINSDDTSEWKVSTYLYSIELVSGEVGDIGLSRIDLSVPILSPTKLKVINYT